MSFTDTSLQGSFWLSPNASSATAHQDQLFYFIYGLSIFSLIIVIGIILYFSIKYKRRKAKERTVYIRANKKIMLVYSLVLTIILAIIFTWGFIDWINLNVPPQDSIEVRVTARQSGWLFTDLATGSESSNLIIPYGKDIKLIMSSNDIMHEFYVPDFRINQEVLVNHNTIVWFKADKIGKYPILCSKYCETKYSQVAYFIEAVSNDKYQEALIANQGSGMSLVQQGKIIFENKGACASCHDISKDKKRLVGPPLFGSYGKQIQIIKNGSNKSTNFNANYIRQSILNPNFRVVISYPSIMPPYQDQLSDKDLNALIEYIKSLK